MDLLLVPIARSFDEQSPDPERWEREERQVYLDGVKAVGVTTAIVNALEIDADDLPDFGGPCSWTAKAGCWPNRRTGPMSRSSAILA